MSKDAEYNDSLDGRERDPQPVDEGDIVRAQEIVDIEAHWGALGWVLVVVEGVSWVLLLFWFWSWCRCWFWGAR
ncbi:hypothetical protein F5B18DRAFT_652992 [Nemania serpens]|nr:hypothetical protein F5B18DRAFT_652992 [Nemania serpens]